MTDSRAVAATIAGAVIGGAIGYLFFTERGRAARRQVGPALEHFSRELVSVRNTLRMAAEVAHEGWQLLTGALGDGGTPPPRSPGGRPRPA